MQATETAQAARNEARRRWGQGLKLCKHLVEQIERLKAGTAAGTDLANFEAIEKTMSEIRLCSLLTIDADFEYACAKTVEEKVWTHQILINEQFRNINQKLRNDSRVVERRKVEQRYIKFLSEAQGFYIRFVQQLSLLYGIPELQRLADELDPSRKRPENLSVPKTEKSAQVLNSCHASLIRAGDLVRYRQQARGKKNFEEATVFYTLAHDIKPESGFGFHQMAIVDKDDGNNLDVIYGFYRAWATAEPHPRASQNLQTSFDKIQKPNGGKQSTPNSPTDVLINWFARYHALIHKGEAVSGRHHELEREVITRLAMAAKDPNATPVLLKMSMVNMAACWAASEKYEAACASSRANSNSPRTPFSSIFNNASESKLESATHFLQYALHFSLRFLLKLCEVVEADLKASKERQQQDDLTIQDDVPNPGESISAALLPVLRIYCMWIAAHRMEVFTSPNAPKVVIPDLVKRLAGIFTLLFPKVMNHAGVSATCPYLLPEDRQIRGLLPLNPEKIPELCRGFCLQDGTEKPHKGHTAQTLDATQEYEARIHDLVYAASFLAGDPAVPMGHDVVDNSPVFKYQPKEACGTTQDTTEAAQAASDTAIQRTPRQNGSASEMTPSPGIAQLKPEADKPTQQAQLNTIQSTGRTRNGQPFSNGADSPKDFGTSNGMASTNSPAFVSNAFTDASPWNNPSPRLSSHAGQTQASGSVRQAEQTVANVLSPFFNDSTGESNHAGRSRNETSYGMGSTTAAEIAEQLLQNHPSEQKNEYSGYWSTTGWDQIYSTKTPKQNGSSSMGNARSASGHRHASHASNDSVSWIDGSSDPFLVPTDGVVGSLHPNTANNKGSPGAPAVERSHSYQGLGAPGDRRPASYGNWPPSQNNSTFDLPSRTWAPQAPIGAPASSYVSAFSHPSSLYQGTPNVGNNYGQQAAYDGYRSPWGQPNQRQASYNHVQNGFYQQSGFHQGQNNREQTSSNQESSPSSNRPLQTDQTASNYDAAILQSAWRGGR